MWGRRYNLSRQLGKTLVFSILLVGNTSAWGQGLAPVFDERIEQLCRQTNSSVIIWDVQKGKAIGGVREEVFSAPQYVGSLIKPFLMLAYLREHRRAMSLASLQNFQAQEAATREELGPCRGKSTPSCPVDCWYKPGHGRLSLQESLAVSCNQYFYQMADQTSEAALLSILREYQVVAENQPTIGELKNPLVELFELTEARIGLGTKVRLIPLRILLACASILEASLRSDIGEKFFSTPEQVVSAGLALSAISGTSQLAQLALLPGQYIAGKTGTSPAVSEQGLLSNRTDGWFLGFYPPVQPSVAVMVRYPNGLGAKNAAPLGGQALRLYLELTRP